MSEIIDKNELRQKKDALMDYLSSLGSVAVAFSSGVDSALLLEMARRALGDKVIAYTAKTPFVSGLESLDARDFCSKRNIRHVMVKIDLLKVGNLKINPPDRCYLCKKTIFTRFLEEAKRMNVPHLIEGSNLDDAGENRPGMRALKELGVKSPLMELGFTKGMIRELARSMNVECWDKPSSPCLATRIPFGDEITPGKIDMIERAEKRIKDMGVKVVRVRVHGGIARIEVLPSDIPRIVSPTVSAEINKCLKGLGFRYVTIDLGGYKTGSMG